MTLDRVNTTVLEAARTHRPDADEIEAAFPGVKAWFGIFTRRWWAFLPAIRAFAGPAESTADLHQMILTAQARPTPAGTRPTITPDPRSGQRSARRRGGPRARW